MWKCQYCDKTSLDDQKTCPYCNAPNPAAAKNAPQAGGVYTQPQGGQTPPMRDPSTLYNPANGPAPARGNKRKAVFQYAIIGVAALLLLVLVTLLFQKPAKGGDAVDAASPSKTEAKKPNADSPAAADETPAPTATPEPTRAPVVVDAVAELYLDFGQTYQCSTRDFNLPSDIPDDEVTWRCTKNDAATTCSKDGLILAGNIQLDCELRYNEEVIVTGTTEEGSVLTYHVFTGDGESYTFSWSNTSRSMRGYISGYVIVSDKMIEQCSGFSVYYEYEIMDGKLEANAWSVWVREDGDTWVRVQDIAPENKVGEVFDISFDRPISFNEIWIMPETYSPEFGFTSAFYVGYMIFD